MMIEQPHHSTPHAVHAMEGRDISSTSHEQRDAAAEQSSAEEHSKPHKIAQEQLTLSSEAEAVVAELKARDQEVRNHEQAHMAAGAGLTSGPTYTYQTGPDGHRYAVGGEVQIDTGTVAGDPEATIKKAEQVRKAALAPANPSAQDMAVAASATQTIAVAQAELSVERQEARTAEKEETEETEETESQPVATEVDAKKSHANPPSQHSTEREDGTDQSSSIAAYRPAAEQGSTINLFA